MKIIQFILAILATICAGNSVPSLIYLSMTRYEIEQEIEKQETDLNIVEGSDEETACFLFNADSKAELIEAIKDEIRFYKSLLIPDTCEDDGMDYVNLQLSQGMAVTHW